MGHIPDMEILLAGGTTKPAREIEVGDKLDTLHQHTLERGEHEVTYVRVIESPLLALKLSGKTFNCSEEDVFYSPAKSSWLKATDLKKGDKISKLEGEVEVEGSEKLGTGESIELTVNGAHTYVLSDELVLLHNKGGGGSPPPPPPKTYTQKEVDELKKGWHTEREAKYDTRLAGQRDLWTAQEGQRKAEYINEQRNLYDDRLKTARGEWRTAADARYDARLGEARTGWHDQAEKRYGTRLDTAKGTWQSEADKKAAATQEEFNKKYGTLQGQYDTQSTKYGDLQSQYGDLQGQYKERGTRYDDLQGQYQDRGTRLDDLRGRHGKLQGRYDERSTRFDALRGRHGELQSKYDKTYADYGNLQGKYGELQGRYDTRGGEYDTLRSRFDERGRSLGRERTGRRRSTFGGSPNEGRPSQYGSSNRPERRSNVPGGSNTSGLSSDAERQALLTGDYSFLNTDKGSSRGQSGSNSWQGYL